ncbi:MAG TPA: ABC transporter permease [Syntrophorhabdaceae bacterium]|nr:ABC transporter permease [Syntrophorhabdaceae bacterium]HQM79995.1 ABC transporter permease [Syntrophorhabdaceae bacterium]
MIIKANVKEALKSLVTAKQRTILALIGIVIGIGSVIGMVSIGTIVQNEALKQFRDMGIDIVSVTKDYERQGSDEGFSMDHVYGLPGYSPLIKKVSPYIVSGAQYSYAGRDLYIELMGVDESFFDLNKLYIREGRLLSDLDRNRFFCVIGAEAADMLQKAGIKEIIGGQFLFGERIYTVIGILKSLPEGGGMRPSGINRGVITHITTAMRAFTANTITTFMARVDTQDSKAAKTIIEDYFSKRTSGLRVRVRTAEELIAQMQKQMQLFTLLLGAIGSIALIVGGIGVMNVMLISVTERRKEIGIRRALGAQRSDIEAQFIIESVTLCFVGGIIGIILGIIISYVFSHFSKWEFLISQSAIVLGFCVATAVGVFFGYYPARSASRLDPAAALRE